MAATFPIELDSGVVHCASQEDQQTLMAAQEILRTGVSATHSVDELTNMVAVCNRYGQDSMARYLEPHLSRASM